jgi:very-short-patch-repair endonuclease
VYEKGGARINRPEAKALVADVIQRLKSPGFRESALTIGVVTFNSEQQALIEDLFDAERRKDPALDSYFSETALEPQFVKNLESVQGDERDIMYFSLAYGPDLTGSIPMNFGPMNRTGGERRLNVAVTRARQELRVFASLRGEQIDLSRTQSIGVRDLKHFLEFAERGSRALAEANVGTVGGYESPFEEAVATELAKKGWELHTQIGASAFRIDLAVVDPDARGRYLAGIECDGATYHRCATARDRDKLREQVLRGLGWEILRIWSTDWWIDAQSVLERIDAELRALHNASRARRAAEVAQLAGAVTPIESPDENVEQKLELNRALYARGISEEEDTQLSPFADSDPSSVVEGVNPDAFYHPTYDETLGRMIAHVVKIEGPIPGNALARRIARAHSWQRTGAKIQQRVESLAAKSCRTTRGSVGILYWSPDHD